MKKISLSLSSLLSIILSSIISLLGFTSCNDDKNNVLMYGAPYGDFEVKGTVTDNEGKPVKDAQVITRPTSISYEENQYADYHNSDTTYTDASGKYSISRDDVYFNYLRIIVHPKDNNLESDSIRHHLKFVGGDHGWYEGKATITQDFSLKAKENKEEEE